MKPKLRKASLPDKPKRPAAHGEGVEAKRASKQNADALREIEESYRILVESAEDAIFVIDHRYAVLTFNPAAARMLGREPSAVTGKAVRDLFPSVLAAQYEAGLADVFRAGQPKATETSFEFGDRKCWLSTMLNPIRDAEGKVTAVIGIARDVTERKQAEREIEQLSRFPRENPSPVLCILSDGTVAYANAGSKALLAALGCNVGSRVPADWQERVHKALSDARPTEHEQPLGDAVFSLLVTPVVDQGYVNVYGHDITERKQAEAALRESETKFRALFENSGSCVAVYEVTTDGADFIIRDFNRAAERTEKVRRENIIGRPVTEVFPGVAEFGFLDVLRRVWKTGEAERHPVSFYKDSRVFGWRESYAYKLPLGEIVAVYEDVSERRQAEEAALESEERFRTLHETMAQGVVYQSADGAIVSANKAAERILGLTIDQMQGRTSTDPRWRAIHEDGSDFPGETHASMVALRTGREVHGVIMGVFNPPLENYRWISIDAIPQLHPGEDKPYQVYATFTDITERKRAEESDRQHLADTALLRDTAVGFIQLAPDADIYQYVADRLSRLVGEAYIIVNSCDEAADQFTVRAIAGNGARLETVLKLMGRNPVGTVFTLAEEHWAEYASEKLLKFEDGVRGLSYGKLPGILAQVIEKTFDIGGVYAMGFHWQDRVLATVNIIMRRGADVRDPGAVEAFVNQAAIALQHRRDADELDRHRIHLEEMVAERTRELTAAQGQLVLQEKLATVGRVAGSVAHELRNPLGAILNASFYLQTNAAPRLEGKELRHLQIIDEYVDRANQAITMILDFTWNRRSEPSVCALRPLVEQAVAEAEIPATVSVALDVESDLPPVSVDARHIVAVFRNLFVNAAQALSGSGTLSVTARRKGSMIAVGVADTGCGIKPEHLDRIFEPLFTTKNIGVGLGLAICKGFIEANKGTISVVSEVGKGTTFTVTLPTAEGQALNRRPLNPKPVTRDS